MKYFVLISVLFVGCANVSTTRFLFKDPSGAEVIVEMPKEVDAVDLKVFINATTGQATIEAREWTSRNVDGIKAQGEREAVSLEGVAKGISEGAVKGINPMP